jgi:hypothetical protein
VILIFALAAACVIAGVAYALYDAGKQSRPRLCTFGNPGQDLCSGTVFDSA